jgi:hypothetical protein
MEFIFYLVSIFCSPAILISYKPHRPSNYVGNINACDSEMYVRNWEVTKPVILDSGMDAQAIAAFENPSGRDQGDNMRSYADFAAMYDESADDTSRSDYTPFISFPYQIAGSFFSMDTYFNFPKRISMLEPMIPVFVYASSIISSDRDQDVIFITSANNGLKLWLNGQLILREFTTGYLQGYQYLIKVHLKKGSNFVLAKLLHIDGQWQFFLKMASLPYANENSLGENYSSICEHYLIEKSDSLQVKLWAPEIHADKPVGLTIYNLTGTEVLHQRLNPGRDWTVCIKDLKKGIYAITLSTDENFFKQYFFYGDYEQYFDSFNKWVKQVRSSDQFSANADVLISRMAYLNTVNVDHDNEYERKVTRVLYEMGSLRAHYQKGEELFTDVRGLHFRGRSSPFYASDTYMIYIPDTYRKTSPLPLVVMVPAETGIREFNISTHVSDINRTEHIMRLADKYGFAVLWSGYRVYINHNLTRMLPDLLSRALDLVRKDYSIDENRIYAYGDCAGGEQALFLANKYPSLFAAVGVEGPAIPDVDRSGGAKFRSLQAVNEDFYNTVINYRNFQTFIFHSINDEKSAFQKSADLYKDISALGGSVRLDTLYVRKGLDLFFTNLMPNNKILTDLFAFYNGKRRRVPDTVWFSTYQLKYNQAFWVRINDLVPHEKAEIVATVNRTGNAIHVQAANVFSFTLDIHDLKLDPGRKAQVFVNNKPYFDGDIKGQKIDIDLKKCVYSAGRKTELTEGPINDFFSSPFLVVKGTKGTVDEQNKYNCAIDTLQKSWKTDYLRDAILCKTDREIVEKDAANYNLVLIGEDHDNPILTRIWRQIPLKVSRDSIQIGTKNYSGKHLSYLFIYRNPFNPGKYVLVIGSNWARITSRVLVDLPYQGWYDYEVYDREAHLAAGYFNNNWE